MCVPRSEFYRRGEPTLTSYCSSQCVPSDPSVFRTPRRSTARNLAVSTRHIQAVHQVVNTDDTDDNDNDNDHNNDHNDPGGQHDDVATDLNNIDNAPGDDIAKGTETNESNQVDQGEIHMALSRAACLLQI